MYNFRAGILGCLCAIWIFEATRMEAIIHASASKIYCKWLDYTLYFSFVKTVRKAVSLRSKKVSVAWWKRPHFVAMNHSNCQFSNFPSRWMHFPNPSQPDAQNKKGQTIKVSPDSLLLIHVTHQLKTCALDFVLFAGGGVGETPRDLVRACTAFIYSRQQVAHEIRLIRSDGWGTAVYSVVSSVSRWRASAHFEHQLWRARAWRIIANIWVEN